MLLMCAGRARKTWTTFIRLCHRVEEIRTSKIVWTLRQDWGQCHQDHRAQSLVTATTVTHRVEKQRMLERFIMENLFTATNTFHFEDDVATNIYTWSYNGNHEPQQIDYILSFDDSLRSRT